MGTLWSLRFDNPGMLPLDEVRACVEACFERVIAQMSTWDTSSDICRYNRAPAGSTHRLAPEFLHGLGCALEWARASEGAIDPTAGPLVALWGFGAQARLGGPPSIEAIDDARRRVDWRQLRLDRREATMHQPGGVSLDLSGIAKGFAVDHACAALHDLGLRNFLLEVGGELRACGERPDGSAWRVQVEAAEGLDLPLAMRDLSIATSGDRWHHRTQGGLHWSHTIDPRSGLPAPHAIASVSVLHPECMQADALATVLAVLGPDQGLAFAQQQGVAALFMVRLAKGGFRPLPTPAWLAATAGA